MREECARGLPGSAANGRGYGCDSVLATIAKSVGEMTPFEHPIGTVDAFTAARRAHMLWS